MVTARLSAYKGAAHTFHLPPVAGGTVCNNCTLDLVQFFFIFNFCELIPAQPLKQATFACVCNA